MNLETPSAANTIYHFWYMLRTDEIETEESLKLHLNLNQPPNQLQHQSTVPKSKKRNYQLLHPQITNLNPTGKKGNFPSTLIFLTTNSAH